MSVNWLAMYVFSLLWTGPVPGPAALPGRTLRCGGPNGTLPFAFDRSIPAGLRRPISAAVAMWAEHLRMTPVLTASESGLDCLLFRIVKGNHGDAFPFFPEGLKISHVVSAAGDSSFPEIHFNGATEWRTGESDPDIYTVALHEVGHACGFAHSSDAASIMYPWYGRDRQILDSEIAATPKRVESPAIVIVAAPEIVYNRTVEVISLRDNRD